MTCPDIVSNRQILQLLHVGQRGSPGARRQAPRRVRLVLDSTNPMNTIRPEADVKADSPKFAKRAYVAIQGDDGPDGGP